MGPRVPPGRGAPFGFRGVGLGSRAGITTTGNEDLRALQADTREFFIPVATRDEQQLQ